MNSLQSAFPEVYNKLFEQGVDQKDIDASFKKLKETSNLRSNFGEFLYFCQNGFYPFYAVPPDEKLQLIDDSSHISKPSQQSIDGKPSGVGVFMDAINTLGFNDLQLLELVQKLSQVIDFPFNQINELDEASCFLDLANRNNRYDEFQQIRRHRSFIRTVAKIIDLLRIHADILSNHPCFPQPLVMADLFSKLLTLIRDSKTSTSEDVAGALIVHPPESLKSYIPEQYHQHLVPTSSIYVAKASYINGMGLNQISDMVFAYANFFASIALYVLNDKKSYGEYPKIKSSDEGLVFDAHKIIHPTLGNRKSLLKIETDKLDASDIFVKPPDESRLAHFRPGLTEQELRAAISHLDCTEVANYLLEQYKTHAFHPYDHIRIDTCNKVKILTGANSNGKTTLLKTIAMCLGLAKMGRKVPAKINQISHPDQVFHDFGVTDNLEKGISKFRAQSKIVKRYLDLAGPDSLGLFDELFNGTSSPYQLALIWAFIEALLDKDARAIISTHEPLITRIAEPNGFESIRGIYSRKPFIRSTKSNLVSVDNISLDQHFNLQSGPVTDSDAFRIIEQEGIHTSILLRAKEVLAHITSAH